MAAEYAQLGASTGASAAIWRFDADRTFDIDLPPMERAHFLFMVLRGSAECELFLDGKSRHGRAMYEPGCFNVVRAGEAPRSVKWAPHYLPLQVFVPHVLLQQCVHDDEIDSSVEVAKLGMERDPELARIGGHLARELMTPAKGARLALDGLVLQMAVQLVRRWSSQSHLPEPVREKLAGWRLRRVLDHLEENLGVDLSVAELAGVAGYSPAHFSRAFASATGNPPHRWLLLRRLERAKELLAATTLLVSEVAAQVGYDDPSYFARLFKQWVGLVPLAYRDARRL